MLLCGYQICTCTSNVDIVRCFRCFDVAVFSSLLHFCWRTFSDNERDNSLSWYEETVRVVQSLTDTFQYQHISIFIRHKVFCCLERFVEWRHICSRMLMYNCLTLRLIWLVRMSNIVPVIGKSQAPEGSLCFETLILYLGGLTLLNYIRLPLEIL